jgi:hypothetical protein
MILRIAVVLIALLVSSTAQAGFETYQSWLALPELERNAYMSGAYDSIDTVLRVDIDAQADRDAEHYHHCLSAARITVRQLAANVMAFASDKLWLYILPPKYALIDYLKSACGAPPTK